MIYKIDIHIWPSNPLGTDELKEYLELQVENELQRAMAHLIDDLLDVPSQAIVPQGGRTIDEEEI